MQLLACNVIDKFLFEHTFLCWRRKKKGSRFENVEGQPPRVPQRVLICLKMYGLIPVKSRENASFSHCPSKCLIEQIQPVMLLQFCQSCIIVLANPIWGWICYVQRIWFRELTKLPFTYFIKFHKKVLNKLLS